MCSAVEPPAIVRMLHDLFASYDEFLDPLKILKVDTVGAIRLHSLDRFPLCAAAVAF